MDEPSYIIFKSVSEYYIADDPDLKKARKIHHMKYDADLRRVVHLYTESGMDVVWRNYVGLT